MKKLTLFLLLLLFVPLASARQGSIKLLAVSENEGKFAGSIADLNLEIADGKGRVFIESFPLSKLDTQITTRFSKQIACNYLEIDCSKYDFFYTIKANSAIVGGPSAGAATTLLTIALLSDIELDKSAAITGTINSGNLIGAVGGLKEKIDAAASEKIKKVLVPAGESFSSEGNKSIDLIQYAESKNITLVEVSDIDDAIYEFTGRRLRNENLDFEINRNYTQTMKLLAEGLCERSNEALTEVLNYVYKSGKVLSNESVRFETDAMNLTKSAEEAFGQEAYYSAASFCYGAAVKYRQAYLTERNLSFSGLNNSAVKNRNDIKNFEKQVQSREISTITDLEAFMIVKERLIEAEQNIEKVEKAISEKNKEDANFYLANAVERTNSAYSWSAFFGKPGTQIKSDKEALKKSCVEKISEAQERYEYTLLFLNDLEDIKSEIVNANNDLNSKNYELCLFKASLAKADADIILSTLYVAPDKMLLLLNQKLDAAKKTIAEQAQKGFFPIFGYSYYEYANSLKDKNKQQALIYAEYAIELSNLDMYFEKTSNELKISVNYELIWFFVLGFVAGVFFCRFVLLRKRRKLNKKKR